jgi:hypothetical protein
VKRPSFDWMIISNRFRKWRVESGFQETTSVLAISLVQFPRMILAIALIAITAY